MSSFIDEMIEKTKKEKRRCTKIRCIAKCRNNYRNECQMEKIRVGFDESGAYCSDFVWQNRFKKKVSRK